MRGVLRDPSWFPSHPPCKPRLQGWAGAFDHKACRVFTVSLARSLVVNFSRLWKVHQFNITLWRKSSIVKLELHLPSGPWILPVHHFLFEGVFKSHYDQRRKSTDNTNSFKPQKKRNHKPGSMKSLTCLGDSNYFILFQGWLAKSMLACLDSSSHIWSGAGPRFSDFGGLDLGFVDQGFGQGSWPFLGRKTWKIHTPGTYPRPPDPNSLWFGVPFIWGETGMPGVCSRGYVRVLLETFEWGMKFLEMARVSWRQSMRDVFATIVASFFVIQGTSQNVFWMWRHDVCPTARWLHPSLEDKNP